MKLVTYDTGDGIGRPGALVGDGSRIADLAANSSGAVESVLWIAEGGESALAQAQDAAKGSTQVSLDDVRLMAPIEPPPQMRDCLCFETHLIQAFKQARKLRASQMPDPEAAEREMEEQGILSVPQTFYDQPIYYKANRFSVVGHEHDVIWPGYSNFMDFELEFGVYIGKPAKDVKKADAMDHVFGYTIFNDFTARDAQTAEMGGSLGPAKGKDFDTANPMGPCLVTADEFGDPYDKTMICRVNGEEWGRGSTSTMHWSFADLIEHISASETIRSGEFLGSGTVGNGCGLEHMRFLKPDDVVELEVEGIGVLRNRLVKPG
ncbi:fumarylacetoacetate hydrolase family protein [Maritimibacter sp. UBA3975]|uniref:fumarylacetoacetate hydrolase family protein n=1 Tax=Maritimibacter sp. UBA3975 TaxID=1946833 RepID=UPI000C09F554|nr:fumarylacetoacetate hydrolase family protein [Maritimibacter sp. UBA3975]MAM63200.1 isomerase [Maritimibacter sp.]|tara:strand:+ start:3186 stop:4145 length:960 start_codon:yes stop_codon:yes gene_type:complete